MDGICIVQRNVTGPDGMVERVELDIQLPPDFPERYREAVVRAADQCTVKQHLELPPLIAVRATTAQREEVGAV